MILKECMFVDNYCYIENEKMPGGKPTGIVVHSTGANNKYLKRCVQPVKSQAYYKEVIADIGKNVYGNHWNQAPEKMGKWSCVHAFIGENASGKVETYQVLPFDICCWGCGSVNGHSYNYDPARIQFEIMEDSLKDQNYFNKVMKEAQEFCAFLCKQYGFGVEKISSHYESYRQGFANGHLDCDYWLRAFGKDMDWFRAEVKKLLTEPADLKTTYKVQIGAFQARHQAVDVCLDLKKDGFQAYSIYENGVYKVQVGSYSYRSFAETLRKQLSAKGYTAFIVEYNADKPIKVGDTVKCNTGVTKYANGAKMASWVQTATLYVRAIENNGATYLLSTSMTTKFYTGRVNSSDVHLVTEI